MKVRIKEMNYLKFLIYNYKKKIVTFALMALSSVLPTAAGSCASTAARVAVVTYENEMVKYISCKHVQIE